MRLHVPAGHQQSSRTLPGPVESVSAGGVPVHGTMQSPAWSGEEMTEKQVTEKQVFSFVTEKHTHKKVVGEMGKGNGLRRPLPRPQAPRLCSGQPGAALGPL